MRKMSKILTLILLTIVISTFLFSMVYAESAKMLQAWFGVKIMYNNSQLISNAEPFIVDGTTYVPLRMLMNTFEKDITWDSSTNSINIFDKPTSTEMALRTQILQKDSTIADLQAKLRKYESGLSSSSRSTSLSDLEDDLNDDYGRYDSKNFDISLSGDSDELTVRIEMSSSDWNNLTNSKMTSLLEEICEDIKDVYDDCKIDGYFRSTSSSSRLTSFYYASNEVVRTNSNDSLLNLEKELDWKYYDYLDSEDIPLYVTISGSTSSPTFKINVDYNKYGSDWRKLSDNDIRRFMSKIYDDIKSDYSSASIDGVAYDTYNSRNLATYYRSSSGTENFSRNY